MPDGFCRPPPSLEFSWCPSLAASLPPLPLSPYNRTCLTTLPTNGRVVSWAYASASRWPRPSWWLPTPVSVLVFPPPLPTPWPSSSGSGSALNQASSCELEGPDKPRATGAGTDPGCCVCYARDRIRTLDKESKQ